MLAATVGDAAGATAAFGATGVADPVGAAGTSTDSGFASPFCSITAPAVASPTSSSNTRMIKPQRGRATTGIDIDGSCVATAPTLWARPYI